MKPIVEVANHLGITEDDLELYGKYKAKLSLDAWEKRKDQPDGKLVLVTAMNPTPAGEGKTLTTIGLSQALNHIGKKTIAALREPSLGPCMGMKGGATGSGNAQIMPAEDINLHFTGDIHAITAAHNLLSALIDNHLFQHNSLRLNPSKIVWKRALDMNDRSLRHIVVGLGDANGVVREDGFMITTASEIMAILCLSESLEDLKERLGRIIIGYDLDDQPVTAKQLEAIDAMTVLLKEAIKPNLVQTIEGTPVIVHGGPFANIAHGCSSVIGTKLALKLADYVVTEAGFGADLGAEKFFDIKCRKAGLTPQAAVLVVTVKALKYNGGVKKDELQKANLPALEAGFSNVQRHIENLQKFGVPVVVAINHFATDFSEEVAFVKEKCQTLGIEAAVSNVWADGGAGGVELAEKLVSVLEGIPSEYKPLYELNKPITDKIKTIVGEIYRGSDVSFSPAAIKTLRKIEELGLSDLPVCMAKTPYSFSDQANLLGAPTDFVVNVSEIRLSAGAGFIVVLTGNVLTMPGLPKVPAAQHIHLDKNGQVTGLM
ncbi:formate--tetrahydrofolate ligase [Brevibacillus laterosporus]|uniref:formate--tetrahydrofolate ligase n=1 Tax=Brevibacillus laterosporus TaxID=1465 RepID=UPI0018CC9FD5|nr:formate--tetrahydrofolate ligase [Brevibacillus laterosporus]MBG9799350.1 formate--tetrahydrofolate ligase [Brevibacillus laterosporus]MCR8938337.1 formate--tetrahydrofolate ligase [Brevibacillus laterosporus]MCZ0840977.1 formate--tetrahydrofolate ligase [Brevibacillus laterosporus]MCZ0845526.1 formate--tetrahydrofolate ligase [Brevibacillus laterosporus]MED1909476.1 formate--tetrahydrofolate ligase [Brevibacillus laterosporus]